MKKLLAIFMFSLVLTLGFATRDVQAEGEIELYPYDQEACLIKDDACTNTKLGDSHWDLTYNGYNWNIPRGGVQTVSDWDDADNSGYFDATETPGYVWGSVGGMIINNTLDDVELRPVQASRADLTGAWRGAWAYFDETGTLQMFEAFVTFEQYIYNDGTTEAPDYRLATQTEIDAYDAATDPVTETPNTEKAYIRIATDDVDTDGYVIEKIDFLDWNKKGTDTGVDPVADWSDIIDGDPASVWLPAGWTAVSFGTIERSSSPTIKEFIFTLPAALVAGTETATMTYTEQPGWFSGLSALDDDAVNDGVNIVVDFNSTFDLADSVSAMWLDMYGDSDEIINEEAYLDYTVEISQDGAVVETVAFTWNETNMEYDHPVQTAIDSSVFGDVFEVEYKTVTPNGDEYSMMIDIVVGVFPPYYMGVEDKYIDEGEYIDLMEGITADDGYGNDLTSTIEVIWPEGFNPYAPVVGDHEINLTFTHNVFIAGTPAGMYIDGTRYDVDAVNPTDATTSNAYNVHIYTSTDDLPDWPTFEQLKWLSAVVVVGADGKVDQVISRSNNILTNEANPLPTTDAGNTNAVDPYVWYGALEVPTDGYVMVVKGTSSIAINGVVRGLPYDAQLDWVTVANEIPDVDEDIVTTAMFTVSVADITAPHALVVNEEYMVEVGMYDNVNDAILANVVAFDTNDMPEDVAVYVSDNGGLALDTPGTYTVEVTVEDLAGNTAIVEFDVVVVAAPVILTDAQVQAMIDADVLTQADVNALIDAKVLTEAQVQALIDAALPEVVEDTGCGSSIGIGTAIVAIIAALGGVGFIARRKK